MKIVVIVVSDFIEDTSMTEEQFLQLSEPEKDEYELNVYNICKQSEFFYENDYKELHNDLEDWYYTFRFDKYEQLSDEKAFTKENEIYHDMQAHKHVNEAMAKYAGTITNSNVPKYLICNSTDIKKISGLSKASSVAMWGIFSRKVHKQWHCNSCGSDF